MWTSDRTNVTLTLIIVDGWDLSGVDGIL